MDGVVRQHHRARVEEEIELHDHGSATLSAKDDAEPLSTRCSIHRKIPLIDCSDDGYARVFREGDQRRIGIVARQSGV
ncbi:MAG TPA: hypothetical protein VFN86_08020, partial [Casimicrobiaceae bacterium]|nr:hypothetical protein [Casimicrobiaceae bacterium]